MSVNWEGIAETVIGENYVVKHCGDKILRSKPSLSIEGKFIVSGLWEEYYKLCRTKC